MPETGVGGQIGQVGQVSAHRLAAAVADSASCLMVFLIFGLNAVIAEQIRETCLR